MGKLQGCGHVPGRIFFTAMSPKCAQKIKELPGV